MTVRPDIRKKVKEAREKENREKQLKFNRAKKYWIENAMLAGGFNEKQAKYLFHTLSGLDMYEDFNGLISIE